MIIKRVRLKNWRNFRDVDVRLERRVFIVGPNASGKSNFLDVFRFLRDIARDGGGLQKAIKDRGGLSKVRCLAAREDTYINLMVEVLDGESQWTYSLGLKQQSSGKRSVEITNEEVVRNGKTLLRRPNKEDKRDERRLTETHLEQINSNQTFRQLSDFFAKALYLHLVPQLLRHPISFTGHNLEGDPFGKSFLERIAGVQKRTRDARLRQIERVLKSAVPFIEELAFVRDDRSGQPHLEAKYKHWRKHGARQREDQFSDGTLRLIGLLWSLLEGDSLLLLEEPELSLHSAVVETLPGLMHRVMQERRWKKQRQVVISTHSWDLLKDPGIDGREVLLLQPDVEGTKLVVASDVVEIRTLLETGMTVADAVIPHSRPGSDPAHLGLPE